ncbi:hypothetical protein J1N35_021851 [Gossypium stocksii]|uniref:Uncharacterized protein n=1 Tax=Gossypium stocksii TaxID=47602 RepID=A0A9D4A2C7_9ROSI|nr:hypothetical protein J1N35_021851 [Gossypium stocksii]
MPWICFPYKPDGNLYLIALATVFTKTFSSGREMDTKSVKSTLSNLAFGNVMAAAARDYKKAFGGTINIYMCA